MSNHKSNRALSIEPFGPKHASAVQRLASDPRIAATTLIPHPYPPDGALLFISDCQQAWADGEAYSFAVRAGETLVGSCGLKAVHDGQAEMGYWIGVPYWGRGYATQAARLVAAFGFDTLGLDRITAHALAHNPGSGRVLEKGGFLEEKRVPSPFEKWPDATIVRYALDRGRWLAQDG